ncbi:MBL fold metallo-hydrolase [Patescibacteria group bacterium]|nr:MBL fold metallo-hydrolase [Patescibacteria group bacterium]
MQIFWQGYSSIRIETKVGEIACTVMTDPFENEASIRFPRATEPDILVLSNQDSKKFNVSGVAGKPFVISDPGEYEVRGVFVTGIQDPTADEGKQRPLVYRIDAEDIGIAFLGGLQRELTNDEIEDLGNIDILILPVGGGDALEAKMATKMISAVEPRIVIPVNYHISGIKNELGTVDQFCTAMGVCKRQDVNKLKISKKDLPADDILVMVIERS